MARNVMVSQLSERGVGVKPVGTKSQVSPKISRMKAPLRDDAEFIFEIVLTHPTPRNAFSVRWFVSHNFYPI